MSSSEQLLHEVTSVTGVSLESIASARERITPHIHRTPILSCGQMNKYLNESSESSTDFVFKAENVQKTGSFKIRGALNAISRLGPETDCVVTHSSGNHGAAVALAARIHGRQAHVVIPAGAPLCKTSAVEGYGGIITRCGKEFDDRETTAERVRKSVNGALIHPYLDRFVVSGQGTIGMEIIEQVPDVDGVIIPIGGGGLISGICVALKSLKPSVVVIGAEPRGVCAAARSLDAGERVRCDGGSIADGVRAGIGWVGWEVVKRFVDRVVVVEEDEIVDGMMMIWSRAKTIVEPAGGVGVAAARKVGGMGLGKVVVVLCGGNVELEKLPWMVTG